MHLYLLRRRKTNNEFVQNYLLVSSTVVLPKRVQVLMAPAQVDVSTGQALHVYLGS